MTYLDIFLGMVKFLVETYVFPLIEKVFQYLQRDYDKQKPLPPAGNPLLLMPAHVLAKKIRSKEVLNPCLLY